MYVYILYSETKNRYYTGQTSDLENRLHRHRNGLEKSTRHGRPWRLVWSKQCTSRAEAVALESRIKKRGARRYLDDMGKE